MAQSEKIKEKKEYYIINEFLKFLKRENAYDLYLNTIFRCNYSARFYYRRNKTDETNSNKWFYNLIKSVYKNIDKRTAKRFLTNYKISFYYYESGAPYSYWRRLYEKWDEYIYSNIDYKYIII